MGGGVLMSEVPLAGLFLRKLEPFDIGAILCAGMCVNSKHPNRATLYLLYTSLCTGELNAIRTQKCFLCSPVYAKGEVFAYVWLPQNLKDLKGSWA